MGEIKQSASASAEANVVKLSGNLDRVKVAAVV